MAMGNRMKTMEHRVRSNSLVNTDAQVHPCALRARFVCAGYLQR